LALLPGFRKELQATRPFRAGTRKREASMAAVVSKWNPTGSSTNCMACVARYLYFQFNGKYLDDDKSGLIEMGPLGRTPWLFYSSRTIPSVERAGWSRERFCRC
jgi:hypothetical protein